MTPVHIACSDNADADGACEASAFSKFIAGRLSIATEHSCGNEYPGEPSRGFYPPRLFKNRLYKDIFGEASASKFIKK